MMNEKDIKTEQSLERAKKTAIKLGTIFGKKAVSLATGGLSEELLELLIAHVSQYQKDERNRRLSELFQNIFYDSSDINDQKKILENDLPIDDLYAIMNYAVQDEETEKVKYYSKLLKYLLLKKENIDRFQKLFILKLFKDLSIFDFLVIKKYFKFHTLGQRWSPQPLRGVTEITSPFPSYIQRFYYNSMREPIKASSIKRLESMNLLGDSVKGVPTPMPLLETIGRIVEFDVNEGDLTDSLQ